MNQRNNSNYDISNNQVHEKSISHEITVFIVGSTYTESQKVIFPKLHSTDHTAGRIAVMEVLKILPQRSIPQITECPNIEYETTGRPFLVAQPEIGLSISHSHGWGASSISSSKHVAIDIEKIRTHNIDLLAYVLTQNEITYLSEFKIDPMELITLIWTMKEAIMKGLGIGLTSPKNLTITTLLPTNTSNYTGCFSYTSGQNHSDTILWTVRAVQIEEFFVSVAYPSILHEKIIFIGHFKNSLLAPRSIFFN